MLVCRLPLSQYFLLFLCLAFTTSGDTAAYHEDMNMTSILSPMNGQTAVAHGAGTVPLDVEQYPIAPPELELEQVHVYVRHGMFDFLYCACIILIA